MPDTDTRTTDTDTHADTAAPWQAYHVFYSASPRPLLLQCVEPLVEELTAEGLLAGHFFINYWLEGAHVRLRLRPASPAAADAVRSRAEAAIAAFLRRRPALYEVPPGYLDDYYRKLFALEYSDAQREALTGPNGLMRLRPNNTFDREPYQPEYGKYGGPAGVALAEWHFQRSSELVLTANRTLNLHLRTVALGFAAQLMTVMAACLIPDPAELERFLDAYHGFWQRAATSGADEDLADFDRAWVESGPGLAPRVRRILDALRHEDRTALPATLRWWAAHCTELRARVLHLTARGDLTFDEDAEPGEPSRGEPLTDPGETLPRLLVPYLHMTNNRLSMSIQDEAYLAYGLARALRELRQPAG
ncbi:lantibiotic dehydratase C-terminal domain-containing protein [Kitasatospora sp. NPDC004669]|uniref:lantibiotic dehydratase C-terminal domain-containing protein n=1 Tax=Kitasatospora sp. NPDC004669 TaxID=3154555 RepID=UPI0033AD7322